MSTLNVTNIQSNTVATPPVIKDSTGNQIGTFCRAWVNFNGTGTVAIRGSFNVSSITDNGAGDYSVNFTSPMPDVNYASVVVISPSYGVTRNCNAQMSSGSAANEIAPTTTQCRFGTSRGNVPAGEPYDATYVYASFFR